MARKPLDVLLGGVTQFGSLAVIGETDGRHISGNGFLRMVICRCACGSTKQYHLTNLKTGKSKSCGCERPARVSKGKTRHGDAHKGSVAPEYRTWTHMIGRCCNPSDGDYTNYGGRGITVCQRWRDSYAAFLADMGRRPHASLSIDRIDNDGNYEPGNCRWATKKEQRLNQRAT